MPSDSSSSGENTQSLTITSRPTSRSRDAYRGFASQGGRATAALSCGSGSREVRTGFVHILEPEKPHALTKSTNLAPAGQVGLRAVVQSVATDAAWVSTSPPMVVLAVLYDAKRKLQIQLNDRRPRETNSFRWAASILQAQSAATDRERCPARNIARRFDPFGLSCAP
jgi:hypothetical protein